MDGTNRLAGFWGAARGDDGAALMAGMRVTKAATAKPVEATDAGERRRAIRENVLRLFPGGHADLYAKLVARYGDKASSPQSVKGLFLKNAPTTESRTVRQVAELAGTTPSELFVPRPLPRLAPDVQADAAARELGAIMPTIERAVDADPDALRIACDRLAASELRHLFAFVAHWMDSKLTSR